MLERSKSHGNEGKQSQVSGIRSAGADGMQQEVRWRGNSHS